MTFETLIVRREGSVEHITLNRPEVRNAFNERMIAGLLKPTSGRIIVNGHDLALEPQRAKASLGFIPDRPFLYEKLTPMDGRT